MKTGIKLIVAGMVLLMCSTAFIGPAFCQSSDMDGSTCIHTVTRSIDIYDSKSGAEHSSSIATDSISGKSSGSTYSYAGTVSNNLFIRITGDGEYAIGVDLVGATDDITITFEFEGSDKIVLNSENGWSGTTSSKYSSGTIVPFIVSVSAVESATKTPCLGAVTFTMIGNEMRDGSSVTISINPITVNISSIIDSDQSVIDKLAEDNKTAGGKIGTTGTTTKGGTSKESDFSFIKASEGGIYGCYISTSNSGNSPNVVDKNTSFVFDLRIPAGQKFCIRFELSTALIAENNVTMTATGSSTSISGQVSLQSGMFSNSRTYAWVASDGTGYSLANGSDASQVAYLEFPEEITLHFDGKRTQGWLTDGTLKIMIIMI